MIPAVGTSLRASGVLDVDNRFYVRGGLCGVLFRDNRGAATNISPWTAGSPPTRNWSPFAEDGEPRDDLFASVRVNGEWITNPDPNEGFWIGGALAEDGGPERAPDINNDNAMILQSNFPFDSDLTEEGLTISVTCVETLKPLMKRLRMNLSISDPSGNPLVEDPGTENFTISKPVDVEAPERQIICFFGRKKAGRFLYTAEGYSLCKLSNIGNFRRSKTDPDAGELGFMVLPDPYLVDKDPNNPLSDELIPVLYTEWTSGGAWTAMGGVPVFPGLAPVAAPGTAGEATVVFDEATGANEPFVYTVEKSVSPFTTWTTATVDSVDADTPTAGDITVSLTGLTAASTKFRVTAEGTNGQTALSAMSNAITVT